MRRKGIALILALIFLTGVALAEEWHVAPGNEENFAALLTNLMGADEKPGEGYADAARSSIEAISAASASDGEVARDIAEHWGKVYLDPDYRLYIYDGGEVAQALLQTDIPDSPTHAFVVLGYELKKGQMTKELKGRCDAAAAAAKAFPNAVLVCSGGPTGKKNPKGNTEAGLMKEYLSRERGIAPDRIFIDERAMTTKENAEYTFAIMREQGIESFTIVTSTYHQKWGQAVYNAMGAICRQSYGYEAQLIGNYCFEIEPSNERYRQGDRIALKQIAGLLDLPDELLGK